MGLERTELRVKALREDGEVEIREQMGVAGDIPEMLSPHLAPSFHSCWKEMIELYSVV